jgi:hypothetical protein
MAKAHYEGPAEGPRKGGWAWLVERWGKEQRPKPNDQHQQENTHLSPHAMLFI